MPEERDSASVQRVRMGFEECRQGAGLGGGYSLPFSELALQSIGLTAQRTLPMFLLLQLEQRDRLGSRQGGGFQKRAYEEPILFCTPLAISQNPLA